MLYYTHETAKGKTRRHSPATFHAGRAADAEGILRFISTKRLHWDIRLKRDSDEFGPVNVARYPQWKIDGIIFGMNPPDDRLDKSIRTIAAQRPLLSRLMSETNPRSSTA